MTKLKNPMIFLKEMFPKLKRSICFQFETKTNQFVSAQEAS